MKNKKIFSIIFLFVTICVLGYIFIKITNPTIRGIVIKANNKILNFMDVKDETLYSISIPEHNDLQFKQGQEILVYLERNAFIEQSNPCSIAEDGIKKVAILKEKSNISILHKTLERFYNSGEKVLITIDELSPTGISITINDTNEFKHEYKHSDFYLISKGKHNDSYMELKKYKNSKSIVNSTQMNNSGSIKNTYNWENVYGKLESGDYEFKTSTLDYYLNIFIRFTIDKNEEITYHQIKCELLII